MKRKNKIKSTVNDLDKKALTKKNFVNYISKVQYQQTKESCSR